MTDEKAIEAAAREAYIAHHRCGPTEEAFDEPNMGRGGFKTEVTVWRAVAQAAIRAYLAQREADGFVEVPVEPTEAMICAGIAERHDAGVPEAWSLATESIYRAMIAAAPGRDDGR